MADILHNIGILLVFLAMISLLVAAHELGHYVFARLFGMGVEEFAVGFGAKPLFTWMRKSYMVPVAAGETIPEALGGEELSRGPKLEGGTQIRPIEVSTSASGTVLKEVTDFTVRPWPLGGFVRIKGMLPQDDGGETRIPGGFYSKAPWKRFLVLLAGPAFSVLFGIMILVPLLMAKGIDRPTGQPIVDDLVVNGPAAKAGMKPGDRITSVQGQPITTWFELLRNVQDQAGKPLDFGVRRGNEELTFNITPRLSDRPEMVFGPDLEPTGDLRRLGRIGAVGQQEHVSLGLVPAVVEAWKTPVRVVKGIVQIFAKPSRFENSVGGPIAMIQTTGQAVQLGLDAVLVTSAILSISVGILNLLPVPPLDGGQMLVALMEILRGGRRLSIRMQTMANVVGMVMVLSLMVSVIAIDIKRLFTSQGESPVAPMRTTKNPDGRPEP